MAAWPASLPQYLEIDNFALQRVNDVVETNMDAGPAFRRTRGSTKPQPVAGSQTVTAAQYQVLEGFYGSTLGEGVLPFTWLHPVTTDPATMRFANANPYQITARGNGWYRVALSLEILP